MKLGPTISSLFILNICICACNSKKTTNTSEVIEKDSPLEIQSHQKLNPNLAPSQNFDLSKWKLTIPTDSDKNGKADTVLEAELNSGYENKKYFFTGKDGGMVFKCPVKGNTTTNSKYARVELREMLRNGNTSIKTAAVNKNNWVFSSAPQADQDAAGAVDGEMFATLAVNNVTTTGKKSHIGRVIIGQIHSNTDEPIRLYYRKLKDNTLGSIYFAHEINHDEDTYYNIIGDRTNDLSNPQDGIALNEKFSYKIKVIGNEMWVTLSRKGKADIVKHLDMSNSGYDEGGQYQYFKAGVYHVNNTGDHNDYAQVTFYNLETKH